MERSGLKSPLLIKMVRKDYEMKTIEEIMYIIRLENNHIKINILEEIQVLKSASSRYLLSDVSTDEATHCTDSFPQLVI